MKQYHFINLNFYNEINDNAENETMTPQVGHDGFEFNIKHNTVLQTPEADTDGLPLTPIESEVFAY